MKNSKISLIGLVVLLFAIGSSVFVSCEKENAVASKYSQELGVESIKIIENNNNSVAFKIYKDNYSYNSTFERVSLKSFNFSINEINGKFYEDIILLKNNDKEILRINYNSKAVYSDLNENEEELIGLFINGLLDIENQLNFSIDIISNNKLSKKLSPDETKCSVHWSKRRAKRELKQAIDDEGGCSGGQTFDADCVCAVQDYLCACCGECG